MSPEQLRGEDGDARSDIFSFGATLYEMVTGRPAYVGPSRADIIAAVLDHDVLSVRASRPEIPPALDWVVRTCLAKQVDRRWQSADDVVRALEYVLEGISEKLPESANLGRATRRRRERLSWVVATVFLLIAAVLYMGPRAPLTNVVSRFHILPPTGTRFALSSWAGVPVVSPDGTRIAFVADGAGGRLLWLRSLGSLEPQSLPGSEGASAPFWAPDGLRIAFFAGGKLKSISVTGGQSQVLCDASDGGGGTWNLQDTILFSPATYGESALVRVSASGGATTPVTTLDAAQGQTSHLWPQFLPDGRRFLYTIRGGPTAGVYVGALDSKEQTRLPLEGLTDYSSVAYTPEGYLLFTRGRTLLASNLMRRTLPFGVMYFAWLKK